jgi:4-hydroxy-3-polyprenylbenzoate decarboxylase
MDVLDHSCSKLGFGGKMCIDGTAKFEEEKDGLAFDSSGLELDGNVITSVFSEVHSVNTSLVKKDIPVLIVSVKKERRGHVEELHNRLCERKETEGIKMILYVEHTVDATDLPVALWRFCNNLDPKRDSFLYKPITANRQLPTATSTACIGFDGTIKSKEHDGFQRDWPNIIVMDEATIKAVDEKWAKLGLGEFLPSPSLKFKGQIYGEEAVVA